MIHIIYKGHFPTGMASTVRCQNYIKAFKEGGFDCKVIIPIPMRSYNEINYIERSGSFEGVPYTYMMGTNRRSKNWIVRQVVDVVGYTKTLLYIMTHVKKEDVVYAWVGGVVWFTMLGLCSKLKSCKSIMEINEIPYGPRVMNWRLKLMRDALYKLAFPLYDGFFVISEELKKVANRYKAKDAKILKVPIIVDVSIAKKQFERNDELYIFHSGTLYEQKDGVAGMLEAFGKANNKLGGILRYYLTGNLEKSRDRDIIIQVINKYHLSDKVKFLGYLTDEELHQFQQNATLMIINKYKTEQNRYCFSTKLGEYLSFSKPVILTNVGEAMAYMKDGVNAYVVEPHDVEGMADAIINIIQCPQKAADIGYNGYKTAFEIFNYKYQGIRMKQFINEPR